MRLIKTVGPNYEILTRRIEPVVTRSAFSQKERKPLQNGKVKNIKSTVGMQSYKGQGYKGGKLLVGCVKLPRSINSK